jgi:ABC-2 type transport system permease protein
MPFSMAPAPIILTAFIVGIFYALDAFYGERRDRSILFWKSLPVSDVTTVVSKALIPLAVLPVIGLVIGTAVQIVLLFAGTGIVRATGGNPGVVWSEFRFFQEPIVMIYGLAVHALWFAPIFAWMFLISAWARRTPVLWALLPLFAIAILERITFGTAYFVSLIRYRFMGGMIEGFVSRPQDTPCLDRIDQLSPIRFLSAPGLWVGLIFAVACLAGAVRLRRYREPI